MHLFPDSSLCSASRGCAGSNDLTLSWALAKEQNSGRIVFGCYPFDKYRAGKTESGTEDEEYPNLCYPCFYKEYSGSGSKKNMKQVDGVGVYTDFGKKS